MSTVAPIPDILVIQKYTTTSTDMLTGTELDPPPADGDLLLWPASTVNTALIEVPQPGHRTGVTNVVPLWANGISQQKDEFPLHVSVKGGVKCPLVLTGTTGTVHLKAAFYQRGRLH